MFLGLGAILFLRYSTIRSVVSFAQEGLIKKIKIFLKFPNSNTADIHLADRPVNAIVCCMIHDHFLPVATTHII